MRPYHSNRGWRGTLIAALLFAGTLQVVVTSGCSGSQADQCKAGSSGDLDCATILQVQQGQAYCDLGTCRRKGTPPPAGDSSAETACQTTEACTAANGGKPSICRVPGQTPCVSVETADCKVRTENWKAKDPIFVGVLYPTTFIDVDGTEQSAPYAETLLQSTLLAEEEWYAATNNGFTVGTEKRPLVGVYCNTKNDGATTSAAYDHVTQVLKAPAIITGDNTDLSVLLPKLKDPRPLVYCTDCSPDPALASGLGNGVSWFNFPSVKYSEPMFVEWTKRLETKIRADRELASATPVKVALIGIKDLSSASYLGELPSKLMINGAAAAGQPASFKEYDVSFADDYTPVADQIVAFKPDIVIAMLPRQFHLWFMPLIEAKWPTPTNHPYYVTGEDAAFARRYKLSVGGNEELRKRVSGVYLPVEAASEPVLGDFLTRFEARFHHPNDFLSASGFDAFYAVAYATAGALTTPTVSPARLSGEDLAAALKTRLAAGGKVEFLPSKIGPALGTLGQPGATIDVVGASNGLDWEPTTGAPQSDAALYCVARPTSSLVVTDAGLYYRYKTMTIDGAVDNATCGY